MAECSVIFLPQNQSVRVKKGSSLLEAASKANITINNVCGGDGICGRCKMIVKTGDVSGEVSSKLTRDEIKAGYVLACTTFAESDLEIEIPRETWAMEKVVADEDADRFRDFKPISAITDYEPSPLIRKVYLELDKPSLVNNTADHERVCEEIKKALGVGSMQMGLKIIKALPGVLRANDYRVTATVGLRRDIAEIMSIDGGDTTGTNYMVVVDMGTTTIVAHLVDAHTLTTIAADACFNSQWLYGREVTGRMIAAEKRGCEDLQRHLVEDINRLIRNLAQANKVNLIDINAVVAAGNTAMGHFLLGLPTENIRRLPYVPVSVEPPPFRAAEVGIRINPRGLLYLLPGISGWVGSDITAGILATQISEKDEICLLVDIGTNGEIVMSGKDWLVATSASAGPALEGASVECGMRAETGAVENVFVENGTICHKTIGGGPAKGICGSGIIDLVSVLLNHNIINRSGKFIKENSDGVATVDGAKRFTLVDKDASLTGEPIFITEADIDNVIVAKAAIFAAIKIILERLDLAFSDIEHLYIAGAFGNYINIDNAINIGLIPNLPRDRIEFVGNTSIEGAKIVAFYQEAFYKITEIRKNTTHYDLMGADDYIEEFQKAMFLPHTDIEQFRNDAEAGHDRSRSSSPDTGEPIQKVDCE